jgi:hypothetical protein
MAMHMQSIIRGSRIELGAAMDGLRKSIQTQSALAAREGSIVSTTG